MSLWFSRKDELGNLTAIDYIEAVRVNWFRFARAPAVIRVDSEGAFKSHEFRELCAARGIEVQMAAGEAHWQIGIVETHIRLLKNEVHQTEDGFPWESIDELVEHCVAAKVRRQTLVGYSPLQWWFATQCAREVEEHGLGENRSSFERRLAIQTAAQTFSVRADAPKNLRMAQYARSRVLRNQTLGELVRYFRRSKVGGGGGLDPGLGAKMVVFGPARVLAVEQPTEVESQVAAVVWLAHAGSLIRTAPEHLVDCSSLDTTLFEAANPDAASLGASWLLDLRNLRRTEYADLGIPRTDSERLRAWQDLDGGEQQQYGHLVQPSQDTDVVPAPPNPETHFPPHLVSPRVSLRLVMSQHTRLACTTNQDLLLVMDLRSMSMRLSTLCFPVMCRCPVESSRLERMMKIPIFNVFQHSFPKKICLLNHSCSRHTLLSHSYYLHEDESPLNSSRENVRARLSISSVLPVPSSEATLAFSSSSLEPASVSKKPCEKVGVEVSYPVTAEVFENPEDGWFATASSRARARVEVNIKKLSSDERAQFRAPKARKWISGSAMV